MNTARTLSMWELRAILAACDRDKRWFGRRDKAMISTFALTGARAGAGVSLNAGQLVGADGIARGGFVVAREYIKRKVHSEEFAIPEALKPLLEQAMADGKEHWRGHGPRAAFVSRRGLRLRREDVTRRLKARCQEAGIDPTHVSAHSLRHMSVDFADSPECKAEGVASGALPDGIENIEVARLFAGHKNRASTYSYVRSGLKRRVRTHVSGMLARAILE